MTQPIEKRVRELALYMIETHATVRALAARFGVCKSTVHKDLTERLARLDPPLCARVRTVLDCNKSERHLRGGEATRRKYAGKRDGPPQAEKTGADPANTH